LTITPYDVEPKGRQLPAGRGEPAGHVHGPGPARGAVLRRAQSLVHVALRGAQGGLGLRAGPQAQQRGRGALRREPVGDPGRREGQPRRGPEVLQLAGGAPVRHRGHGRETEQHAHRQQDEQHQLGAHLQPREQRDARAGRCLGAGHAAQGSDAR
jgi:hypothetical protein